MNSEPDKRCPIPVDSAGGCAVPPADEISGNTSGPTSNSAVQVRLALPVTGMSCAACAARIKKGYDACRE